MMSTQLADLSLPELREALRATERAAGPDAKSTAILRRLVSKREAEVADAEARAALIDTMGAAQ